ncbi:MAG: VWA domain-containing protein, partial [Dehalococcoidia bacterium]|nr:VWA domain-containing protein [Dehalococcoidia bacterium]
GGEGAGEMPQGGEEVAFETPPQPEFRGDFKPELAQLLMKLRLQQGESDGTLSPITQEQLQEMLEKSVEITISEWAEGDLASSLGLFLSDLDKDMATPAGQGEGEKGDRPGGGEEAEPEEDLPIEIEWSYYDEWDFRAADYRPRWCRVGERPAEEGELDYYEETLRKYHGLVMETRRQFELLRPETFRKIKRLEDGDEIDLDRALEFIVDKRAGVGPLAQIYWRRNKLERDVAVAFLLDMSASTDEEIEKQRPKYDDKEDDFDDDPRKYFQWLAQRRAKQAVEPPKRIIDLEKESSVLIVEALEAIGDSYGIYGFSGYGRENVEFYSIKALDEMFSDRVRKRIDKIEPIRSTRMGPAVRHTIDKLDEYDAKVKILILVSDGRPQDHGYGRDRTEKEYAVHDTRQALLEAKRKGITPFLITVDKEGHDYLGEMCQDIGYEVVSDIESLPRRLPSLYRALATD